MKLDVDKRIKMTEVVIETALEKSYQLELTMIVDEAVNGDNAKLDDSLNEKLGWDNAVSKLEERLEKLLDEKSR